MNVNRFHSLSTFFRNTFGTKVYKLSLAGKFTCPVRDGSISTGGCSYCNPSGNVPRHYNPEMTLIEQLEHSAGYVRERHGAEAFLAYFQDYTTTYGDTGKLEKMCREALDFPGVRGLSLCTRPDCLSEETVNLLADLSQETFVWVELGIQSASDATLTRMNRGHTVKDSEKAFDLLHSRGIKTAAHVILGYPGESREEALATAEFVRKCGTLGVKIQNLHVLKNTALAEQYERGEVTLQRKSQYAALAADFIERIEPGTVIQRLTGEAPPRLLVAPEWSINKLKVMDRVKRELMYRDSWQGKALGFSLKDIPSWHPAETVTKGF